MLREVCALGYRADWGGSGGTIETLLGCYYNARSQNGVHGEINPYRTNVENRVSS